METEDKEKLLDLLKEYRRELCGAVQSGHEFWAVRRCWLCPACVDVNCTIDSLILALDNELNEVR
jgi:hypothetical protein